MENDRQESQAQSHGEDSIANNSQTIDEVENVTHQKIAKALSKLAVQDGVTKEDSDERSDKEVTSDICDLSKGCVDNTKSQTDKNVEVDPALVEAMRVNRDKLFVRKYEKEMEDQIRNNNVSQWELPLMNTYQRMLVHRIADHYRLGHSLDPTTKQVTLLKKEDTYIPDILVSVLAEHERLSDPVEFPPLLKSLSGQSTPANGATSASSVPGPLAGFRIMRREGANSASRSESSRNGSNTPEDGNNTRKDRKTMTMEEREAAYKEARQRIFGSEEVDEHNSESAEPSTGTTPFQDRKNTGSSRSTTPFNSVGEVVSRQAPSQEESVSPYFPELPSQNAYANHQISTQYPYPNGGWPSLQIAVDGYGRPLQPQHWPPPQQQYAYDPQSAPFLYPYAENTSNSGISSRSTSISTGTEGAGSAHSSTSDPYASGQAGPSNHSTSSLLNSSIMQSRSQSVSPSSPFVPRMQPTSGNNTPGGSYVSPQSATSTPQNAPWTAAYPYYGAVNYSTPASPMDSNRNQHVTSNLYINQNGANGQFFHPAGTSFNAPYPRPPLQGNSAWPNGVPQGTYFGNAPAQQSSQYDPYLGTGRGRGRVSQGSERSLYDPNKPSTPKSASSTSSSRHSLGKSSSAAAMLENGFGHSRMSGSSGMSTPVSSRAITPIGDQARRSSSSNTRNGHPVPSAAGSTGSSSSISSINHPSLPARPNWVTRQNNSSHSTQSTVAESESCNIEKQSNGDEITSSTDDLGGLDIKQTGLNGQDSGGKG